MSAVFRLVVRRVIDLVRVGRAVDRRQLALLEGEFEPLLALGRDLARIRAELNRIGKELEKSENSLTKYLSLIHIY